VTFAGVFEEGRGGEDLGGGPTSQSKKRKQIRISLH
jgi:hypothetical protein